MKTSREQLVNILSQGIESNKYAMGLVADRILEQHAFELAEEIRGHAWDSGCTSGCCDDERGAEKAADLIDPGAEWMDEK